MVVSKTSVTKMMQTFWAWPPQKHSLSLSWAFYFLCDHKLKEWMNCYHVLLASENRVVIMQLNFLRISVHSCSTFNCQRVYNKGFYCPVAYSRQYTSTVTPRYPWSVVSFLWGMKFKFDNHIAISSSFVLRVFFSFLFLVFHPPAGRDSYRIIEYLRLILKVSNNVIS